MLLFGRCRIPDQVCGASVSRLGSADLLFHRDISLEEAAERHRTPGQLQRPLRRALPGRKEADQDRGGAHSRGSATVPGRCSKVSMTSHSSSAGS
ncbi:hypothetical protein SAVIM338S_07100 [Streptomyces avidinii]